MPSKRNIRNVVIFAFPKRVNVSKSEKSIQPDYKANASSKNAVKCDFPASKLNFFLRGSAKKFPG